MPHSIPPEVYSFAYEESFEIRCKVCQKIIGYAFIPDQKIVLCAKCGVTSLLNR